MPVQQDHRSPQAAMADAQSHLADVDMLEREGFEHEPWLPRVIPDEPGLFLYNRSKAGA